MRRHIAVSNRGRGGDLTALRSGPASGVTGVSGRLLFGLQRALTFRAFGRGALGLTRSVALGLLRTLGIAGFLLRFFDFTGHLDRTAFGSMCRARGQPFCQCRVSGVGAKLFQRGLPRLGRGLLSFDEIRLLEASHLFSTLYLALARPVGVGVIAGSGSCQRTRQPMTVASIGLLVSTLCQAPLLHWHKNGIT